MKKRQGNDSVRVFPRSMLFNLKFFWLQGVKASINNLNIKREQWC